MDQIRANTFRIYFVSGFSFLLLASTFYFIGINPLLERLRAEHVREIDHSIDSSLWLLQGVLGKHHDIAAQSASRTAIRKKQIAYLEEKVSLKELAKFSAPKLADALVANEEISGISRYDLDGNLLFNVGYNVPEEVAKRCWGGNLKNIRMLRPMLVNDKLRLVYCSPINDRIAGRVGTDILLIDDMEVWRIIDDLAGSEAITVFGVTDNRDQVVYWPRFLKNSPALEVLNAYLDSGQVDPAYIIESRELKLGGWHLFSVVNQQSFYADIDHQFRILLLMGSLVMVVIYILTVLVLRPVIRAMLSVEKLTESSHRDGLTGLYNHVYMQELLDQELARIQRSGQPLSLMMMDIDYFKKFNDDYGHQAGDQVLRELSQRVSGLIRKTDHFARYGGEEFLLILPDTSHEHALLLAERVRVGITEMVVKTSRGALKLTVSVGMVSCPGGEKGCEKHQIIEVVDSALYQSKNEGRNRVTSVDLSS